MQTTLYNLHAIDINYTLAVVVLPSMLAKSQAAFLQLDVDCICGRVRQQGCTAAETRLAWRSKLPAKLRTHDCYY